MSKKEFIENVVCDLRDVAKNKMYINISQLASALGISRDRAREITFGLYYIPNGKEKLFYIPDVANMLFAIRECDGIGVIQND